MLRFLAQTVIGFQSNAIVQTKSLRKTMSVQYFVCLDFEATCWPGKSSRDIAEIIGERKIDKKFLFAFSHKGVYHLPTEFPAVLLNVTTSQIESEFRQFVRPTNHPKLSPFCLRLTGITQQQVDQAQSFPEVFRDFMQWLDDITARKQLVFYTKENVGRSVGQNATFSSWASFDLRHYFQLEMRYHRLTRPDSMTVWVDFEVEYKVLGIRNVKLFLFTLILRFFP